VQARPLDGVRVLDLSRVLSGPSCGKALADLGADVIKVEPPEGDLTRTAQPRVGGLPVYFAQQNCGKRCVSLDLRRDEGRALVADLAAVSDIVLENFRPGVLARYGLDYASVRARNPAVVYCSITGYGQDGPYADRSGHDINYIGVAGVADQIGTAEAPVVPNFQIADLLGGALTAVMGILAALVDARTSGRGRHVDVSMTDAVLAHAVFPLLGLLERGTAPERGATLLGGGVPCYNHYRTRDGRWMAVGALEAKFWDTLCDTLGCPELKGRRLASGAEAKAAIARLAAIFATRTQAEWTEILARADCCVSPVLRIDEALEDEQLRARGMIFSEDGMPRLAFPVKFSEFEFGVERPAPARGEHTDEILREAGCGPAEIEALRRGGVI
jgi:crotonobetainyl-CoA:carnitine CoA-transferase CaiB-like acyl-CoA transferase